MVWLGFSVLVGTIADGDGATSRGKYIRFRWPEKQLLISAVFLKKKKKKHPLLMLQKRMEISPAVL